MLSKGGVLVWVGFSDGISYIKPRPLFCSRSQIVARSSKYFPRILQISKFCDLIPGALLHCLFVTCHFLHLSEACHECRSLLAIRCVAPVVLVSPYLLLPAAVLVFQPVSNLLVFLHFKARFQESPIASLFWSSIRIPVH